MRQRSGYSTWSRRTYTSNRVQFYKFSCLHCREAVFARSSELWGVYGRVFECPMCRGLIRLFKRTRAFPDKCKDCENPAACMTAPTLQVGTGTSIKKKEFSFDELRGRILIQKSETC